MIIFPPFEDRSPGCGHFLGAFKTGGDGLVLKLGYGGSPSLFSFFWEGLPSLKKSTGYY